LGLLGVPVIAGVFQVVFDFCTLSKVPISINLLLLSVGREYLQQGIREL